MFTKEWRSELYELSKMVKERIKKTEQTGIDLNREEEEKFVEDEPVTRAYAASTFGAMAAGATVSGNAESFADVPASHLYAAGILQALQNGILNSGNSKFYPNKNATYEDIAQWALKVINYDVIPENKQPLAIANELDLFKGINSKADYIVYQI